MAGIRRSAMIVASVGAIIGFVGVADAAAPGTKVVEEAGRGQFAASCPGRSVALGGGAGVDDPGPPGPQVFGSVPLRNSDGEPRRWRGYMKNPDGTNAKGFVQVVCGKRSRYPGLKVRQEHGGGAVRQLCQDDEVATGGGAMPDGENEFGRAVRSEPIYTSRGVPKGWKGHFAELLGETSGITFAICMRRDDAPRLKVRHHHSSGQFSLRCRRDEVVTGGGAGVDQPQFHRIARNQPTFASNGRPFGWKANFREPLNPGPGSGTVYVICAS